MARGRKSTAYLTVDEAYVCCEEYDFLWDKKDLLAFYSMWEEGKSILDIADQFKRKPQEVLFLVIDQYDANRIQQRTNGIWGEEKKGWT